MPANDKQQKVKDTHLSFLSTRLGQYLYRYGSYLPTDVNGKAIPEEMLAGPDPYIGILVKKGKPPRNLIAMIRVEGSHWLIEIFGEHNRREVMRLMGSLASEFQITFTAAVEEKERKELI